ncbi:MAG: hypothetical protein WB789_09470 [Thermoplasmata archaeon]
MNPKLVGGIVVGIALVVLIVALYYWVPEEISEHSTLTLTYEQNPPWRQTICIPGTNSGHPNWTNVSFSWTVEGTGPVTLVVWESGQSSNSPVYNVTGVAGLGWYSSQGTEYFSAFGAESPSVQVTVDLSYVLPGHLFGGPIVQPQC